MQPAGKSGQVCQLPSDPPTSTPCLPPITSLPLSTAPPRQGPPRQGWPPVKVGYARAGFPNLYQPENDPSSASYVQPNTTSIAGSQGKRRSRKLQMLQWATGMPW